MRKVTPPESKELPKLFGERVRYLRKAAGQSQDTLAKVLDVTRNYVNMIEKNNRIPNIDALSTLAKHFDVSSDFLLCLSDDSKGKADVMAVEKRLGLSPTSQEALEFINERAKNGSFIDSQRLKTINLLLENELQRFNIFELASSVVFGDFEALEDKGYNPVDEKTAKRLKENITVREKNSGINYIYPVDMLKEALQIRIGKMLEDLGTKDGESKINKEAESNGKHNPTDK